MGELANKIRAKYPKVYDALSDDDLEAKVVARYPGVYDHLVKKSEWAMNPAVAGKDINELQQKFIQDEGTLGTRVKEGAKAAWRTASPYVRPVLEAGGSVAGATIAGAAATPETLGTATVPAAITGGALGYAAGKNIADTFDEMAGMRQGGTMTDRALTTVGDLATGATMEMAGPVVTKGAESLIKGAGNLARKQVDTALKQGTAITRDIRDKNVTTALENNLVGGGIPNAVTKLDNSIAAQEAQLSNLINKAETQGVRGTTRKAIDNLEALKEKARFTSDPDGNLKLIEAEIERLKTSPLETTGPVQPSVSPLNVSDKGIALSDMQKAKVTQGKEISNKYIQRDGQQSGFMDEIDKARVRGYKEGIEEAFDNAFPELAGSVKQTNKQLSDFYSLRKELGRAANRIDNRASFGLYDTIKPGVGATIGGMVAGPPGAAVGTGIGAVMAVLEHPATAPRIAQSLYKASKGGMTRVQAMEAAKERIKTLSYMLNQEFNPYADGSTSEVQQ